MDQNTLCHHGIKGQKWGVRRYQNPDGSLTAAGKKRFKRASNDEKIRNEHSRNAKSILYQQSLQNKENAKMWKQEAKEAKVFDDFDKEYYNTISNLAKESIRKSKMYDKLLSDIEKGTLVAGRDFVTAIDKKGHITTDRYGNFVSVEDSIVFKRNNYEIKDNKTYNKTGIKVTRDKQNRVVGLSAKDASNKQIRKIHKMQRSIARKGDY